MNVTAAVELDLTDPYNRKPWRGAHLPHEGEGIAVKLLVGDTPPNIELVDLLVRFGAPVQVTTDNTQAARAWLKLLTTWEPHTPTPTPDLWDLIAAKALAQMERDA